MSGISASEDCVAQYNAIKTGKGSFGVLKIKDERSVECTFTSEKYAETGATKFADFKEKGWPTLVAYITENLADEAAYVVTEFLYVTADEGEVNKLVMLSWCPEGKLKVKAKMLHGSTMNTCLQQFGGIQAKPVQCVNFADLDFDNVVRGM